MLTRLKLIAANHRESTPALISLMYPGSPSFDHCGSDPYLMMGLE